MNGSTLRSPSASALLVGPIGLTLASYVLYRLIASHAIDEWWPYWVGLIAALITGGVLLVAGASKIVGHRLWLVQAGDMGVPTTLIAVVPGGELAVGALLIVGLGWPMVPWVAASIFAGFGAFISSQLLRGQRPSCACFGAWSSRPIERRDVWRNAGLIGLALLSLLR